MLLTDLQRALIKEPKLSDRKLNILFVASEVEDFVKTGGLADVAKALPLALKEQGHDVRIIMPLYRTVKGVENAEFVSNQTLRPDSGLPDVPYQIKKLQLKEVPVYGIHNAHYFDRAGLYGEENHAYGDNGERFAFFSLAVLQSCDSLDFTPDIIHCNDWHTALIPFLLKTRYAHTYRFQNTRTVLTCHNAAYQGIYDKSQLNLIPEVASCLDHRVLENYSYINYLKAGVLYADKVNTVSPNYASELLTPLGSHGMSHCFVDRMADFEGIINGCDYNDWDPAKDEFIPANYNDQDIAGKSTCKQELQREVGLGTENKALFGMVCRLTEQKGFNILLPALTQFLKHDVQLVIVGTGDPAITGQLCSLAHHYPDKFKFINTYSNKLSHMVEAGADFFLMPSLFEPCGLNQMYSLAYGTLPIVRGVGGLKDTVNDYDQDPDNANGFIFYEPEDLDLLNILRRTLLLYLEHPEELDRLKLQAMKTHFSWNESVLQYEKLYFNALNKHSW